MIELQGISQIVNHVALSADGVFAAGGGHDAAYCWNLRDHSCHRFGTGRMGSLTTSLGFTSDSRYFAVFGLPSVGSFAFDLTSDRRSALARGDYYCGAVSPAEPVVARFGPYFYSVSLRDHRVLWRLQSRQRYCPWAAYRDDGSEIFISDHESLTVRRATDGVFLRELPVKIPRSGLMVLSPDSRNLAFCDRLHVFVSGVETGKFVAHLRSIHQHFTAVAFHPSGQFLATTSNDTTVRIWDTTSWREVTAFTWDAGRMRSVCFAPDGLRMAAGTDKGKVVIWDADL